MIKRYRHQGRLIFIPTVVASNNSTGETASTKTFTTDITGEPGSVVTFTVTGYTHSDPGANYTVDGVTKVLTDTFTRTLDGSGNASFVQFIDAGTTTPGNGIDVILTITNTTIGFIGIADDTNISKIT